MELFLLCRQFYPERQELLRNMMGLIGNVAEVPYLRCRLLAHAQTFSDLLFDKSDGIEVSYNAAGVLSHILSDGAEFWSIDTPTRATVVDRMYTAIGHWDLNTKRNINYR
ncbi:protein zer-1 homolog [Anneissia japonica]|uniref:protein zer-1 homolog n=1 Tax=Anneissia japonica TaxID=1529436 RepID=UPI0014258A9F|nr:protein zer-1 homolog [Anneissia japonica]